MIAVDLSRGAVIVTGGGAGIGRAIATRLAAAGASVAVVDIDAASAESAAAEIEAAGGTATAVVADVCDLDAMQVTIARVTTDLGPLTGLVNNAGVTRRGDVATGSLIDWDRVMEINYRGTLVASRCAFDALVMHGGAVVNVTSVAATHVGPGRTGYASSKAATMALTRQMALEWGGRGVRVNAVAPGVISGTTISSHESSDLRARRAALLPLRRTGDPLDIANAVAFLLSDLAGYITGQALTVDGGWSISLLEYLPGIGSDGVSP